MSVEENKALIRRVYDLWNRKELAAAFDLFATSYVAHTTDRDMSLEEERKLDGEFFAAFPDATGTLELMVAEGDKVAIRVTWRGIHKGEYVGVAPTGKRVEMTNSGVFRIAGGKVSELWAMLDNLRFMQQLGMILTTAPKKQ